jgi:hypothetical protein
MACDQVDSRFADRRLSSFAVRACRARHPVPPVGINKTDVQLIQEGVLNVVNGVVIVDG